MLIYFLAILIDVLVPILIALFFIELLAYALPFIVIITGIIIVIAIIKKFIRKNSNKKKKNKVYYFDDDLN